MNLRKWNVIGLMSGTSLDGLDIALCEFISSESEITSYKILKTKTYPYTNSEKILFDLMQKPAEELSAADAHFGQFCGHKVLDFLKSSQFKVDFIASHGHTIFHQPQKGFTTQIGNGAVISSICSLPVVSDFRSMDVALGGQGAPLVPIGDLLLFKNYKFCINLGGIANISIKENEKIFAFDICPANMALNFVISKIGLDYDDGGKLASAGNVSPDLLIRLNSLAYYESEHPKSLGKEWFDKYFVPELETGHYSVEDLLATICEHIAMQTAKHLSGGDVLITGGGAYNSFLISRIENYTIDSKIVIPDKNLIEYKEALIFAFLGLLRVLNMPNSLASVTGAKCDSIGGALYGNIQLLYIN